MRKCTGQASRIGNMSALTLCHLTSSLCFFNQTGFTLGLFFLIYTTKVKKKSLFADLSPTLTDTSVLGL